MGASASLNPDTFAVAKAEYEARKGEITDDAEMFNHLRSVIEGGSAAPAPAEEHHHAEEAAPAAAEEHHHEAPAEAHAEEAHHEAAPAEAAPAEEAH